jgi:hypothetical protein
VRYLLEGSVRKSSQRIRISVQLIDAASAKHLWAERYDLELTEVFAVQDEIAERVAGAIEPELLKSEGAQAAARHTGNMTAWDLVRRGTWHFHQVTRENHLKARELFRQACKLDHELPEAHIWLARVSAGVVPYGWSDNPVADLQEGVDAALKAIQLDERITGWPSSTCIWNGSSSRSAPRERRSRSAPVSHWAITFWGWRSCSAGMHRTRSRRSNMGLN